MADVDRSFSGALFPHYRQLAWDCKEPDHLHNLVSGYLEGLWHGSCSGTACGAHFILGVRCS